MAATARFTETLPQLPAKKDTAVACTLSSVWGQWRTRSRADHKAARCHWLNNAVRSMGMAAQHAWMRILDAALARPDDRSLQASVVYSFRFSRFRASSARAPSASDLSVTTYPLRKIHSPDTCLPRTPLFRDLARSPCEDRADRFRHERVLAGRCSKHLCAHVQQLSRTQGFETTWTLEPKAENLCGHVQRLTLPQGAKQN